MFTTAGNRSGRRRQLPILGTTTVVAAVPASIPDLMFWFEADNINLSNANNVPLMLNRAPWFAAMSPSASSTGATLVTNQLNGLPALSFPGSSVGRYTASASMVGIFNAGASIFTVINPATVAAVGAIVCGAANSLEFRINASAKLEMNKTNVASIGTSTGTLSANAWTQAGATYNPSSGAFTFRIARATSGTGTNAQTVSAANNDIGFNGATSSEDYNGKIAAIIMYGRVLTATEIGAVEGYLNKKWGV